MPSSFHASVGFVFFCAVDWIIIYLVIFQVIKAKLDHVLSRPVLWDFADRILGTLHAVYLVLGALASFIADEHVFSKDQVIFSKAPVLEAVVSEFCLPKCF